MNSQAPKGTAPWLVFAVGNPSRGDDALGPMLVEQLQQAEAAAHDVDFLVEYQWQVEHALDVHRRLGVLFVDAALPGTIETISLSSIRAGERITPASHALRAEAVLSVAYQLDGCAPPAWQLAIEGHAFGLGDGLSGTAEHNLQRALEAARQWLDDRRIDHA